MVEKIVGDFYAILCILFTSENVLRLNLSPIYKRSTRLWFTNNNNNKNQTKEAINAQCRLNGSCRVPHGMATDLDDDYFSDDGFDTLPPSTLLELEQNAFQATQRQQELTSANGRQAQKAQLNQQTVRQQGKDDVVSGGPVLQQPAVINLASSDYGDLDVGVLDAGVLDNGEDPTPFEETKRLLVIGFSATYKEGEWLIILSEATRTVTPRDRDLP